MKIKSLTELTLNEEKELIVEIKEYVKRSLKSEIFLKNDEELKKDLDEIREEIKTSKAFFRVILKNGNISGFYYIRLNDKEKFLNSFFEVEAFYSKDPSSFFTCMKEATKDLKTLKERFPDAKGFIGYYTVNEEGRPLAHAKRGNKIVEKIIKGKTKELFITYGIS